MSQLIPFSLPSLMGFPLLALLIVLPVQLRDLSPVLVIISAIVLNSVLFCLILCQLSPFLGCPPRWRIRYAVIVWTRKAVTMVALVHPAPPVETVNSIQLSGINPCLAHGFPFVKILLVHVISRRITFRICPAEDLLHVLRFE